VTSLADILLLRTRWRRVLERHAIDTVNRDDFALGGLATRLQTPSVQLLVFPADPEAEVLHLDDALWVWLEAQKSVDVDGRAIRFSDRRCPTTHAAALVNGHGTWKNYLAVHRSGAIELGLGDCGGWERQNREGELVRVFNLISIVTYTWAVLKFGAVHYERLSLIGPWHLTVAVRGTEGALLGNVGEAGLNLAPSKTAWVVASSRICSGISTSRTGPTRKVSSNLRLWSVIDSSTRGESANAVTLPTAVIAWDVSICDISLSRGQDQHSARPRTLTLRDPGSRWGDLSHHP
jgi:hypothetical protein